MNSIKKFLNTFWLFLLLGSIILIADLLISIDTAITFYIGCGLFGVVFLFGLVSLIIAIINLINDFRGKT